MMNRFLLTAVLFVLATASLAQPPVSTAENQREHMEKVAWLAGTWKGEGFMQRGPDERHDFRGTEKVEARLGGLVLVIEGFHRASDSDDVVHHAFAMLTWDDDAGLYRFRTQLANGRSSDSTGRFEDGAFIWSPPTPPGMEMRYIIREDEHGDWFEIGEMSRGDQGWRKFFEMRLKRTGD